VLATPVYVASIYGVAALTAFGALAWKALPLITYDSRTWVCFALLAVVPTMIGHTSFNHALRWIPPGRLSVATLSEPLLGGAVAWFAWDEPVSGATVAGYVLICASVLVLVLDRTARRPMVPALPSG
jgi:drug/metabolite transporter (DMT)-like permease